MGRVKPDCLCELVSSDSNVMYLMYLIMVFYSNLGLAACLASPSFFLPDENYVITIHLKLTAIILASTCALIIIFVPKLISIARYVYGKHKSKLWRGYRGNRSNSAGYFNDAGYGVGSSSQENNNNSDNMATQNLLDFSVQAHEGVLPVKKVARFNYMSIWELKHVVVVPLKRFFILMNVRMTLIGYNKGANHSNRNKDIKHEYIIILHVNQFQHPRIDVFFEW